MKKIRNEKLQRSKIVQGVMCFALLTVMLLTYCQPAYAYDNGAYIVSRSTSYVNPETGQTDDGGSNIALGDSMCASIVDTQVLVEVADGRTYVTIGLGMMSNISDIRIAVQNSAGGGYSNVGTTLTGSCNRSGDTCNHYRFEVVDPQLYIRPTFYVAPMGRDVTFYIKLDMSSMTSGTGNFVSQMVPAKQEVAPAGNADTADAGATDDGVGSKNGVNTQATVPDDKELEEDTLAGEDESQEVESEQYVSAVDVTALLENTQGLRLHTVSETTVAADTTEPDTKKNHVNVPLVCIVAACVLAAGGIGFMIHRKKGMKK